MASLADQLSAASTFLFVPAARPDRFDKAVASGADVVVLDLEDAVAPEGKVGAREQVASWLGSGGAGGPCVVAVRVNGVGTPWHDDDVATARTHGVPVMLPKAESAACPPGLAAAGVPVVALIETAVGVQGAAEVARWPEVVRLAFGTVDFAAELGLDHSDRDALSYARSVLALASAAAGLVAPVDGVTVAVRDADRLTDDCRHALARGFTAKLCIHPSQVPAAAAALAPDAETVRWARAVVEAAAGGAVAVLDGALVDKPVVDRARSLLARAGQG
ncbi:CoA ester lyase [Actinomycetospora endophytica]|uniref:CoA ester lyase n=1 Tax=Actinomycetospora endophytica TaxID=2291215 RepID=A0ABS8PCR2_9PSEU|nr:CoA ester lyase [Actinomycetospora endophytica]MCD2196071.1 CoA ester lyase [Actinomycetospora endophytica]